MTFDELVQAFDKAYCEKLDDAEGTRAGVRAVVLALRDAVIPWHVANDHRYWALELVRKEFREILASDAGADAARKAYWDKHYGVDEPTAPATDFAAHLARQRAFSERTFGPGERVEGVSDHIRKELLEVAKAELGNERQAEWIDVVMLALDGAWRSGMSPEQIIQGLRDKLEKNERRTWPDWRTADPNKAIEHERATDTARGPAFYLEEAAPIPQSAIDKLTASAIGKDFRFTHTSLGPVPQNTDPAPAVCVWKRVEWTPLMSAHWIADCGDRSFWDVGNKCPSCGKPIEFTGAK